MTPAASSIRPSAHPGTQPASPVIERPKLVFYVAHFLRGGIESTLVEWLRLLAPHYAITLAVLVRTDEFEFYRSRLPADLRVRFLLTEHWLLRTRLAKMADHRLGPLDKLIEEVAMPQLRKAIARRRLAEEAAGAAAIVDYDLTASRFVHRCEAPRIGFFHLDIGVLASQQPRRHRRMRNRISRYERLVTVNRAMLEQGRTLFPLLAERFRCLYNTLDLEAVRARSTSAPDQPPARLVAAPFVLAIGNLIPRKNFLFLLDAFATALAAVPAGLPAAGAQLVILGEGEQRDALAARARELDVGDRLHLPGYVANPFPWLRACTVFALTSTMEALPTVMIEALALGKAVVSVDCPSGPDEILDGGQAGVLLPPGDATAFGAALARLLVDARARDDLERRAARRAAFFGTDGAARRFGALLAEVGVALPAGLAR